MLITNTKNDKLTLNTVSAWPAYATVLDVPKEYTDMVKAGSGFYLMINSKNGTEVNGIYSWDGVSWKTRAQANDPNTESGTTAARPTANLKTGRRYFDTTLNKPIWRSGAVWVLADGTTV